MKEKIEPSSGNLYADLGYKNAEEMEAKAVLAREIYRLIKRKNLSPQKAASFLRIPLSSLSRLMAGNFRKFSTDRLLHFLKQLGRDIDINVVPSRSKRSVGRISVRTQGTLLRPSLAAKGRG